MFVGGSVLWPQKKQGKEKHMKTYSTERPIQASEKETQQGIAFFKKGLAVLSGQKGSAKSDSARGSFRNITVKEAWSAGAGKAE